MAHLCFFNLYLQFFNPIRSLFHFLFPLCDAVCQFLRFLLLFLEHLFQVSNFIFELLDLVVMVSLEIVYCKLLLLNFELFLADCTLLFDDLRLQGFTLLLFLLYPFEDFVKFLFDVEFGLANSAYAASKLGAGFGIGNRERETFRHTFTTSPLLTEMASFNLPLFLRASTYQDVLPATETLGHVYWGHRL
jgi:hypothetical protein